MVNLAELATLRKCLLEATDLSDAYGYFSDHFGSDPTFIDVGQPMKDPRPILEMVGKIIANLLHETCAIAPLVVMHIPEHRFVHGVLDVGTHLASFFYFEDVESGLCAVGGADSPGPSQFVRFSLVQTPDGKRPTLH